MSNPRWDIELEFLSGPLRQLQPQWYNGPLIRIGRKPGAGGVCLRSYPGLATIHATIQAYNGTHIKISTIGSHLIRIATHENVNWDHVHPLPQKAYLSPGDIIHLGQLNKGCRFRFVQCQTFEWRKQNRPDSISQKEATGHGGGIDITPKIPAWFVISIIAMVSISLSLIFVISLQRWQPELPVGIIYEDINAWKREGGKHMFIQNDEQVSESLLKGFEQPFDELIMKYNAQNSGLPLYGQPKNWDQKFYAYTVRMTRKLSNYAYFWKQIHHVRHNYAKVLSVLRQNNMPDVFAAIPMQETGYQAKAVSPLCAAGIWQFVPETARRVQLAVSGCTISGRKSKWTPDSNIWARKKSPYYPCRIKKCDVDNRFDVSASTQAATKLLREAWDHPQSQASGSAVQMTIIAHNVGFNDSSNKTWKSGDILPTYLKYRQINKNANGVKYYGDNILCNKYEKDPHKIKTMNDRCGGLIPNQPQHYGYNVVAKHLIAVCYYAKNFPNNPIFAEWRKYTTSGGYCQLLKTPSYQALKLSVPED